MDILNQVDVVISDSLISESDVHLIAYNIRMPNLKQEHEQDVYNPKKNPDKAINIVIETRDNHSINIFLNTKTKEWDSCVDGTVKLSPEQMEQFFQTNMFKDMCSRISRDWPLTDPFYCELFEAINHKKLNINQTSLDVVDEDGEFRKGNIDKDRSKEKNAAGVQVRTNSGRIIVTFSDFGVEKKDQAKYYCWPKPGSEFKWSQWNLAEKVLDDKKTNPIFIRMSFFHAGYEYGLNLGLRKEVDDNRGFFGYNLTLEPKLQWTTPVETNQMLELSIVKKFLSICKKRIEKYISMSTDEIYDKISNQDKITKEDIENTKKIIRRNLQLVREPMADTYIYD